MTLWSPEDGVRRVLVVTAHPDDVDFGSAGTIAAFTSAGVEVTYCIVTNGEAGGSDRSMTRAEMAALRQDEQRAAAATVGVTDVRFLGYPDGRVQPTIELRGDISRVIRQVRPERVITQSPLRNLDSIYASHPDHLAAGEAALDAVYPDSRNPFAHPELLDVERLEPWTVPELWIMGPGGQQAGVAVDTTATVERKVAALLCHKSQMSDPDGVAERVRDWARGNAGLAGLPEGRSAELFRVIRIP
jgi:LmbE family N-acetylglucosaminyl deacetylase